MNLLKSNFEVHYPPRVLDFTKARVRDVTVTVTAGTRLGPHAHTNQISDENHAAGPWDHWFLFVLDFMDSSSEL